LEFHIEIVLLNARLGTYRNTNPNHPTPDIQVFADSASEDECFDIEPTKVESSNEETLSDDQLLLATPLLYGFSLSDKYWRESVELLVPADYLFVPLISSVLQS
jgi:hypothetical protein